MKEAGFITYVLYGTSFVGLLYLISQVRGLIW